MPPIKVRVYDLSKELNVANKDIMTYIEGELKVTLKSHSSSIEDDVAAKVRAHFKANPVTSTATSTRAASKPANQVSQPEAAPPPPENTTPRTVITDDGLKVTRIQKTDRRPTQSQIEAVRTQPQPRQPVAPPQPVNTTAAPQPVASSVASPALPTQADPVEAVTVLPEPPPAETPETPTTTALDTEPVQTPLTKPMKPSAVVDSVMRKDASKTLTKKTYQIPTPQIRIISRPSDNPDYQPPSERNSLHRMIQPGQQQQRPHPGGGRPPQQPQQAGAPVKLSSASPSTGTSATPKPGMHGKDGKKKKDDEGDKKAALAAKGKERFRTKTFAVTELGDLGDMRSRSRRRKPRMRSQGIEEKPLSLSEVTPGMEVHITGPLSVGELAAALNVKETDIIKELFMKGMMVTVNQILPLDQAKGLAESLGFTLMVDEEDAATANSTQTDVLFKTDKKPVSASKHVVGRAPVISIMGHVDHGKTSLLDAIRETRHKIVDTEAGGITQRIGAYSVEKEGNHIVFLDTPGHEAFTAMRMRGAQSTDIAILVVAADDGVMPQTLEAISHAKAAGIPIIVAVNKIDKEGADPDKVLIQLSEHGLVSEKWGGDVLTVEVSALQRLGLEDLLEMILLVAELQDLKADPTVPATGVIIESKLDKQRGPLATALVQNGTLRVGDNLLIGAVGGRVRALINDKGERIEEAGPSTPVEILGLQDVPQAGEGFQVLEDERAFKEQLEAAQEKARQTRLNQRNDRLSSAVDLNFGREVGKDGQAEMISFNVILKADTQGSLEAVSQSLQQLSTNDIRLSILHTGTGNISEADVMLASASNAVIIGFNVREDGQAEAARVPVYLFDVIYHIVEKVEQLMLGELAPEYEEVEIGTAEVRQLFPVGKNIVIAGCMVQTGKLLRNEKAKVTRNGKEIYTGPLSGLKRFKDDAKEVAAGYECGISFDKFNAIEVGDLITVFESKVIARTSL